MTNSIKTKELTKLLAGPKEITLLDVRRKADYQAAPKKIPKAVWQDPESVDTWVSKIPKDAQVVAYCVRGGPVSQSVTDRLRQKGANAVFLDGGIKAWVEKGHPVE